MPRLTPLFLCFLCLVFLVVAGLKSFQVYDHAHTYRVAFLDKAFVENGERVSAQSSAGAAYIPPTPDASHAGFSFLLSSRLAYVPRYYVLHPTYEIAERLNADVDTVFGYFIVLVFALYLLSGAKLLQTLSVTHWSAFAVFGAISLIAFLGMNGRAAPAFLGYSLIAHSIFRARSDTAPSLIRHTLLVVSGLVLSATSSGLFVCGLLLFVAGHLLRLPQRLSLRFTTSSELQSPALRRMNWLVFGAAVVFCMPLVDRLLHHFGAGLGLISGLFSHGAGHMLLDGVVVSSVAAVLAVAAVLMFQHRRALETRYVRARVASVREPLFLALVPLPLALIGYGACTPALFGVALVGGTLGAGLMTKGADATGDDARHARLTTQ